MIKDNYKLWVDWHFGKINRRLTKEEISEIRACEMAMHLLVPTDSLLKIFGGCENMKKICLEQNGFDSLHIRELAEKFQVPYELMFIKMYDAMLNYNPETAKQEVNEQDKKENNKILKKADNIIHINFKKR